MRKRVLPGIMGTIIVAGCNSLEAVQFSPALNQSTIVRDGVPAIVSRKNGSIVMMSPAKRGEPSNGRLVFVVAMTNLSKQPIDFHVSDISATQITQNGYVSLDIIPYEQLANEEQSREVAAAVLMGLAAGANSYSAAYAGYGHTNGTVYTPNGTATFSATYYDPAAAAVAQTTASAQNDAMIANTIETGRRNMAALEHTVLKDNTIMPGEWIGGQVHLSPPVSGAQPKRYSIAVNLAGEAHQVEVIQGQGP